MKNFATEYTEKMNVKITENIIGEVHKKLGPGLLESIYEEALCYEFSLRNIKFKRQVEVDVIYKNHVIKGQKLDILVEDEIIVELKSLQKLPDIVMAQVLSYLKATGLRTALIINFGAKRLVDGIKRLSL